MGVKETVKENLIRLRREHKLTQLELSEKINYSDKAISRWETGEVTPDVETLEHLATLYNIPITAFFLPAGEQLSRKERKAQKRTNKAQKRAEKTQAKGKEAGVMPKDKPKDPARSRRVAFLISSLCLLWMIAITLFVVFYTVDMPGAWHSFIWGVPATFLLLFTYFFVRKHAVTATVFLSLLVWTALTATYLQIALWRLYPLLFLGIPLQTVVLLLPFFKKKK